MAPPIRPGSPLNAGTQTCAIPRHAECARGRSDLESRYSATGARTGGPVVTPLSIPTVNRDARELSSQTRANANNGATFDGVYAHNMKFVLGTLRNMGVQDSALDDAAQEVFVVVHRRLSSFDGRNPIRGWLFAIAFRIASAVRRSSRRNRAQAYLDSEIEDAAPSPHELAERAQALRASAKLLAGLNANQCVVLMLTEVQGLTAQEIANTIGVGVNTVYTRLRRARQRLSKLVHAGIVQS